jgi:hypothetical protein
MNDQQQNTTWLIDLDLDDQPVTHRVTAARPTYDERYFPGFILMKNDADKNVAYIPVAAKPYIRRQDADPTMTPRPSAPAGPVPRPPFQQPASQADLARLAERGGKAGEV